VSRNAQYFRHKNYRAGWFAILLTWFFASHHHTQGATPLFPGNSYLNGHVTVVHNPRATDAFQPRPEVIRTMVGRGLTNLTGKPTPALAWLSLLSTQDVVGLKVYSAPGPRSGTRPDVVAAVIESLLQAGLPPNNIILWDKHRDSLRRGGFLDLAKRFGIRAEGSAEAGYDEQVFYEMPLLGYLVWGDVEFGKKGEGVGRKSFVSKLVSKEMTKIINITPLLNHYRAGVTGNLYGLAAGSVDNFIRFETDSGRLAQAVPEIYALPEVGDRVVVNIVDALICQYQGEQQSLLHYSATVNELRFSTDPVALDILSLQELNRHRKSGDTNNISNILELFNNAALLELGTSNSARIQVERIH